MQFLFPFRHCKVLKNKQTNREICAHRLCDIFFLGRSNMHTHLLTPEKEPTTDQSMTATKASLVNQ